jgi:alkanesulfonate monooxygenase SsuD/methylene tetrahydromethanopterin reductase-like flavin-dependent oxidoreductase (luciferase family)
VVLPQPPEDMGEWLADAAAFDTAGADALWIDPLPDAGLDPLAVAAALATLTFRALLVAALPDAYGSPQARARTLATVARLSRGRLALCGERARLAEITGTDGGRTVAEVFYRVDAGTYARARGGVEIDQWVRAAPPAGREPWRAAIADATERSVGGLLVPAEPRLLDILRNPDDPGDRHDLQLANG